MVKLLFVLSILILLMGCDEHIRSGASGRVSNIRELYGNIECYYSLETEKDKGFYSEDVVTSMVKDTCGKYQIGDTITIRTEKSRLTIVEGNNKVAP